MADLSPTRQAIANYISACAEARRQGELEDWKLIPEGAEFPAYDAMDDALVALCAARPAIRGDLAIWQSYLRSIDMPRKIDRREELLVRIIGALIGETQP